MGPALAVLAAARTAATVQFELKRGLHTLATIAHIAPLLAILLTLERILSVFSVCVYEKSSLLPAMLASLAQSLSAAALGILVGLLAHWCYRHLRARHNALALEMQCALFELANTLRR